jgi:hypothetical protein
MGYQDDRPGGDNRWRNRDDGRWNERGGSNRDRDSERASYGRGDYGRGEYRGGGDDRGFFERAGDEVRSWFGDDEAQHRREADERRWEREQRMTGPRDNDYGRGGGYSGYAGGFGGGWGNQQGESWNRDRPGVRSERDGWFSDSIGGERGERYGGGGGGDRSYGTRYGVRRAEHWEGTGFSGPSDRARRFDRGDPGSGDYGAGNSSRNPALMRDSERGGGQHQHDPHYSEWRRRQIEDLDRDYDEYRREHQSKFENEFGSWRTKRQSQRQLLGTVRDDMEVVGSDGARVGTVDKVHGDRIVLKKDEDSAGGMHHSIPCSWVEGVEGNVTLNRTAQEAMREWRGEDRERALFEREDSGSEGPHALNRSFAGTYDDDENDRRKR